MPLRALLDQLAPDFPGFCKVGTRHNQKIDFDARGFIAVAPSVQHLVGLKFDAVFVDEAHHPLPSRMPEYNELYRFSATHTDAPDFRYPMGQAIDDGVLCDYDITVPAVTEHHAYVCLADLLLKQAGRFRRVLAYCNTVAEAKKFQMVLEELGLAAWHINGTTSRKGRMAAIEEFSGSLLSAVHVMVTVEVLGEGINIPNADTCMFVEPRNSYRSVIQAIGRVLRHHPGKTLSHIVLPAVAVAANVGSEAFSSSEMGEAARIIHGHAATHTEHGGPNQALTGLELPLADTLEASVGESAWASNKSLDRPTQSTTCSRGIDAVETSTGEGQTGPPTFHRGTKRSASNADKEQTHQEEPDFGAAGIVRQASSWTWSSSRPSSPSSTWVTSVPFSSQRQGPGVGQAEQLQPSKGPSPMPWTLSASVWAAQDRAISPGFFGGDGHSGADTQQDLFNGVPMAPTNLRQGLGEHGANQGSSSHAAIKEAVQKDTALWEQLRHCNIDSAQSPMEQQAVKSSAAEAHQRGASGPPIRRVQVKSSLETSDPNNLYGSQLERFLSLLVQADSRLVGSSVGHRIQLVDCRMTAEGQELDSLTQAVYTRLTAILRQRDLWEEGVFQSLEALVKEKGRLPLRSVRDEKTLAYWLNTQQYRFRAGLLLENRWRRLTNSSSLLIRQRVQGWVSSDQDGKFKRWCLELKTYVEMKGELPRFTYKTPDSQSHRLAVWLKTVANRDGWSEPARREMLESLHPLVAELVAKWDAKVVQVDLPTWQSMLQRLVARVQAKGHLRSSTSSDRRLYNWLDRNLRRLQRLPRALVKQLHDSHPLIDAKVRAAQALHAEKTGLKRSSQGFMGRTFDPAAE